MTQAQLAELIQVSDKTISKWETMRGLPDISLLEPLAAALGVSVLELLAGECVTNRNVSSNMRRSRFYVCPVCGNVIHAMGESVVSCCGIVLPVLEAEDTDEMHDLIVQKEQDEYYVHLNHPMTKEHYISFAAYLTSNECSMKRFYPEETAEVHFLRKGHGTIYVYCNQHGLYRVEV